MVVYINRKKTAREYLKDELIKNIDYNCHKFTLPYGSVREDR